MHIYYIIHYFPPELNGGATRASDFARLWSEIDHEVTVLTGFPNHPSGIIPAAYQGKMRTEEEKDGYTIRRTFIYATPNKGTYRRILNHISLMLSTILGSLLKPRPDVIIASSPPLFLGLSGYVLSRILRVPLIFEVRDIWPQQAVDLGMLKNPTMIKAMEWLELFLYAKADLIIGVAQSTAKLLAERGVPEAKIKIIPNATDLSRFYPSEQNTALKSSLNLDGKFVVSYIGTMGLSQGLSMLIEAARQLQRQAADVHFLLIGDGAERETLIEMAQRDQLTNVTFLPSQPREVIPDYYRISDATVVPLRNVQLFESTIPSKIFEVMACGIPVILGVKGEAATIMKNADAGICITPESIDELIAAIHALNGCPQERKRLGSNGHKYVAKHYDRHQLAIKYGDLMQGLVQYAQWAIE